MEGIHLPTRVTEVSSICLQPTKLRVCLFHIDVRMVSFSEEATMENWGTLIAHTPQLKMVNGLAKMQGSVSSVLGNNLGQDYSDKTQDTISLSWNLIVIFFPKGDKGKLMASPCVYTRTASKCYPPSCLLV